MGGMMDNYLTALYQEWFKLIDEEKRLMKNTEFEDSENGKMANIRNDQSISEIRKFNQVVRKLIELYLAKIKNED